MLKRYCTLLLTPVMLVLPVLQGCSTHDPFGDFADTTQ